VDVAAIVARAVETAQPTIDAQGHELQLSVPAEPLWLEADPTRMTQVVANLLQNAAKFSERAGRIWLTAERQGNAAVIRVRDEGAGIAPDLLPHIFDLFVQGSRSLERMQGGLGIGLTVVHRLVELHGGTVTARSEGPGQGSEFTIRLPLLQDMSVQTPAALTSRPAPAPAARRVLVVDDNVDAAESVAMLMRCWGHEVRLAHDGTDGLRVADEYRPDLILLDIGLPGLNGHEVAKLLREKPEFAKTMLVAVTGYGQRSDRERSMDAGFDLHLTKPVDPERLQAIVSEVNR
jgi:CheY-like chemotaxis protein/anti-sigma regulatory factor (Ser/Thr protein kinase)